jgi:hypothetical protein
MHTNQFEAGRKGFEHLAFIEGFENYPLEIKQYHCSILT